MTKRPAPLLLSMALVLHLPRDRETLIESEYPNLQARIYLRMDSVEGSLYLQRLVQSEPDKVDEYISSLHTKTIQRVLRLLASERTGEFLNELPVILRQSYLLSKFPVPNVTVRKSPLLQIVDYTSALADLVPLRARYNDPSLLAFLPQGEFRGTKRNTIPAFHYGATSDRFILISTVIGRHYDQQSTVPVFVTYHAGNPT